jgi:hypothetical protein
MDNNWPPKEWTEQDLQDFARTYQPYEREAMGRDDHKTLQRSRERLVERLGSFYRSLGSFDKVKKIIDEACKKNGGLPF